MASSSAQDSERRAAIITNVRVHGVRVNERGNWLFVRIETRAGHEGIGELSHGGDDAQVARIVERHLKPWLVGRELPFRAELIEPPERIVHGELELPLGPGLGARLNEDVLADRAFDPLAD